jgi:hypothetical protein
MTTSKRPDDRQGLPVFRSRSHPATATTGDNGRLPPGSTFPSDPAFSFLAGVSMDPHRGQDVFALVAQLAATFRSNHDGRDLNPLRPTEMTWLLFHLGIAGFPGPGDSLDEVAVYAVLWFIAERGGHSLADLVANHGEMVTNVLNLMRSPHDCLSGMSNPAHAARAAEFVVAYLLGWARTDRAVLPNNTGWPGRVNGARLLLTESVTDQIGQCVEVLMDQVPGAAAMALDPLLWNQLVANQLLATDVRRCPRTLPPQSHMLLFWRPGEISLQDFIRRAIRGIPGQAFKHKAFAAGLLNYIWRAYPRPRTPSFWFRLEPVVVWKALGLGVPVAWTLSLAPPFDCTQNELGAEERLILVDGAGTPLPPWTVGQFHVCQEGNYFETRYPKCPLRSCHERDVVDLRSCYYCF